MSVLATHGGNYTGDIAIDDVKLSDGTCRGPVSTTTLAPTTLAPRVDRFKCNFEKDICDFKQVSENYCFHLSYLFAHWKIPITINPTQSHSDWLLISRAKSTDW